MNRHQEEREKEKREVMLEVARGFGLPVVKGEVVAYDTSFGVEFGDVVVTITYPAFAPRDDIASFAQSIASFPEIFTRFGIEMADANDDFDKILLTLKILADLFSKRTSANDADISIVTSDDAEDEGEIEEE